MTPKEKAEELVNKFSERRKILTETKGWVEYIDSSKAKGHALTAVDEILKCAIWKHNSIEHTNFWKEVKKEIQNL
jgi:hypothetical protein